MPIQLSEQSIECLAQIDPHQYPDEWRQSHLTSLSTLRDYFLQPMPMKRRKDNLAREALHHSLLVDIKRHYQQELHAPHIDEPIAAPRPSRRYYGLLLAGVILFACEGFDGIVAVLTLITQYPVAMIIAGIIAAAVTVAVNLQYHHALTISEHLLAQWTTLNELITLIESEMTHPSPDVLLEYKDLAACLRASEAHIIQQRNIILKHHHSLLIQLTKYTVSGLIGLLVFCAGFFLGQGVGVLFAGLLSVSAAAVAWPFAIVGAVVGLAAIALYLSGQVDDIHRLVARWFGYDEVALEQLSHINTESMDHFEQRIAQEESLQIHIPLQHAPQTQPMASLGTRFRSRSWSGPTMFGINEPNLSVDDSNTHAGPRPSLQLTRRLSLGLTMEQTLRIQADPELLSAEQDAVISYAQLGSF